MRAHSQRHTDRIFQHNGITIRLLRCSLGERIYFPAIFLFVIFRLFVTAPVISGRREACCALPLFYIHTQCISTEKISDIIDRRWRSKKHLAECKYPARRHLNSCAAVVTKSKEDLERDWWSSCPKRENQKVIKNNQPASGGVMRTHLFSIGDCEPAFFQADASDQSGTQPTLRAIPLFSQKSCQRSSTSRRR